MSNSEKVLQSAAATDGDQPRKPEDVTAEEENTADEIVVSSEETAGPGPARRTTEQVRQGHTGDHVRYILGVSILGVMAVFIVALIVFFGA